MPTITQVTVPKANGQVERAGSVLSRATPVANLSQKTINLVLYGQNRVGKTLLACQFPKPLLLVSFEPGETGGAITVVKIPGVEFVPVATKAEAVALARELRGDTFYKTHVLDTCTSLQSNVIMRELMNTENAPVQLDFGTVPDDVYKKRSEQAKEVMQFYRDLPTNTIFVAQERDHNKGQEGRRLQQGLNPGEFLAADLGPATVKWMHDSCDFIIQLYLAAETKDIKQPDVDTGGGVVAPGAILTVETGRSVRRLRCILDRHAAAGFRSPNPEVVPTYIETDNSVDGPRRMYEDLMRVIRGERALKGFYPKE